MCVVLKRNVGFEDKPDYESSFSGHDRYFKGFLKG